MKTFALFSARLLATFGATALIFTTLAFLLLYLSSFNLLGISLAAALIFIEIDILNWVINNY